MLMSEMKIAKLWITVFAAGVAVLVVELAGARLLSTYYGDTLFSWTSSISTVLGALALGYFAGGKLADRNQDIRALSLFVFAASVFICITPFISQAVLQAGLAFGYEFGPLFASVLLLAVPNVFLGMVSPFAVRVKSRTVRSVGESAGNLYAISTIGSIVGALLSGYLLLPFLGVSESLFLVGALLIVAGTIVLGMKAMPLIAIAALLAVLPAPQLYSSPFGSPIYQTDSPYFHIDVINDSGILMLQTSLLGIQTLAYANLTTPSQLGYYDYQSVLYYGPNRVASALYLGLGGGSMVSDLYNNTNASIDVVELDPSIISIAEKYFGIHNGGRVHIYNEDARFFLRNSSSKYDMIVLDTYGTSLVFPSYMTTLQAAEEMKDHLNPNGSVIINVVSPLEGEYSGVLKSVYSTFSYVFPTMYVFPTQLDNPLALQNIEIIASTNTTKRSASQIAGELNGRLNPEEVNRIVDTYYNGTINTAGFPPLTDDKNPLDNYAATMLSGIQPSGS